MDNRTGNSGSKELKDIWHPELGWIKRSEAAKLLGIAVHSIGQRLKMKGWNKLNLFTKKKDNRGRPPKKEGQLIWREPLPDYNPNAEMMKRLEAVAF